jgi:hypothetical protein
MPVDGRSGAGSGRRCSNSEEGIIVAKNDQAIQKWYTNRLREYYSQYYRASISEDEDAEDPEELYPKSTELGRSLKQPDPGTLPPAVQEAYQHYKKHVMDEDWGTVRVYHVRAGKTGTYAVRVTTDGDDGWLEVYSETGALLGAGRTYIELVAWGTPESIRAQIAGRQFPPDLDVSATLWGKPLDS